MSFCATNCDKLSFELDLFSSDALYSYRQSVKHDAS